MAKEHKLSVLRLLKSRSYNTKILFQDQSTRSIATVYQNYQTVCSVHVAKELLLDEGWIQKSMMESSSFHKCSKKMPAVV